MVACSVRPPQRKGLECGLRIGACVWETQDDVHVQGLANLAAPSTVSKPSRCRSIRHTRTQWRGGHTLFPKEDSLCGGFGSHRAFSRGGQSSPPDTLREQRKRHSLCQVAPLLLQRAARGGHGDQPLFLFLFFLWAVRALPCLSPQTEDGGTHGIVSQNSQEAPQEAGCCRTGAGPGRPPSLEMDRAREAHSRPTEFSNGGPALRAGTPLRDPCICPLNPQIQADAVWYHPRAWDGARPSLCVIPAAFLLAALPPPADPASREPSRPPDASRC